jgi:hypothetical protein
LPHTHEAKYEGKPGDNFGFNNPQMLKTWDSTINNDD